MPLGLETELPTPYGWVKVNALEPGMELLDEAGYPTRVRLASPPYLEDGVRLRLGYGKVKSPEEDGELLCGAGQVLMTAEHRRLEKWHENGRLGATVPSNWTTWVPGAGNGGTWAPAPFAEAVTVEQIAEQGVWKEVKHGAGDVRTYLRHAIPAVGSLQIQGGRVELDPWVAGVCINYWDPGQEELLVRAKEATWYRERFAAAGYRLVVPEHDERSRFKHLRCRVDANLERQLAKYLPPRGGIPNWVFRAREQDRMAFLAGLMDQWNFSDYKNNVRAGAWLYTPNEVIARGACDLVRTLGYPATLRRAKQVRKDRGGEVMYSGFYVLWSPLWLPFSNPELMLRYSRMTYRAGMSVQRFLWKIYEAEKIERILVRDIVVDGTMFAAGRLLVPVRCDSSE